MQHIAIFPTDTKTTSKVSNGPSVLFGSDNAPTSQPDVAFSQHLQQADKRQQWQRQSDAFEQTIRNSNQQQAREHQQRLAEEADRNALTGQKPVKAEQPTKAVERQHEPSTQNNQAAQPRQSLAETQTSAEPTKVAESNKVVSTDVDNVKAKSTTTETVVDDTAEPEKDEVSELLALLAKADKALQKTDQPAATKSNAAIDKETDVKTDKPTVDDDAGKSVVAAEQFSKVGTGATKVAATEAIEVNEASQVQPDDNTGSGKKDSGEIDKSAISILQIKASSTDSAQSKVLDNKAESDSTSENVTTAKEKVPTDDKDKPLKVVAANENATPKATHNEVAQAVKGNDETSVPAAETLPSRESVKTTQTTEVSKGTVNTLKSESDNDSSANKTGSDTGKTEVDDNQANVVKADSDTKAKPLVTDVVSNRVNEESNNGEKSTKHTAENAQAKPVKTDATEVVKPNVKTDATEVVKPNVEAEHKVKPSLSANEKVEPKAEQVISTKQVDADAKGEAPESLQAEEMPKPSDLQSSPITTDKKPLQPENKVTTVNQVVANSSEKDLNAINQVAESENSQDNSIKPNVDLAVNQKTLNQASQPDDKKSVAASNMEKEKFAKSDTTKVEFGKVDGNELAVEPQLQNMMQEQAMAELPQQRTHHQQADRSVNQQAVAGLQAANKAESLQTEIKTQQKEQLQQQLKEIPLHKPEAASAINESVKFMMNQRVQAAEIRLDPQELGSMQIKISINGDQASVSMVVQNPQAKEMLDQAIPKLKDMLEQSGIELGESNIEQRDPQANEQGEQGTGADGQGSGNSDEGDVQLAHESQVVNGHLGQVDYYA